MQSLGGPGSLSPVASRDGLETPGVTSSNHTPAVTVVLCDDVPAFRALMRTVLGEHPEIAVVGEAGDGLEVIRVVSAVRPDVVLLDLAMPYSDGLAATPEIRRTSPSTRVIGLSAFGSDGIAEQMIAAGASAYLEKGTDLGEIARTVLDVARAAA
ncbi:MAG: response regulator transcription factor [Solirubrobacterales bacterium]|nr:response regulator transcription factor [Solirubrobacterales bacterium]